ncbi:hypothetical protein EB796_015471 [Bugula neritina]|uniref:Uncharacterized protein n=1 Tax=Bugula neritina TaxID=10212 RepID=A0A7J7JLB3_BUGNE|nr:hypothetical protein EB796_015471 [Bugula neritina]
MKVLLDLQQESNLSNYKFARPNAYNIVSIANTTSINSLLTIDLVINIMFLLITQIAKYSGMQCQQFKACFHIYKLF